MSFLSVCLSLSLSLSEAVSGELLSLGVVSSLAALLEKEEEEMVVTAALQTLSSLIETG